MRLVGYRPGNVSGCTQQKRYKQAYTILPCTKVINGSEVTHQYWSIHRIFSIKHSSSKQGTSRIQDFVKGDKVCSVTSNSIFQMLQANAASEKSREILNLRKIFDESFGYHSRRYINLTAFHHASILFERTDRRVENFIQPYGICRP